MVGLWTPTVCEICWCEPPDEEIEDNKPKIHRSHRKLFHCRNRKLRLLIYFPTGYANYLNVVVNECWLGQPNKGRSQSQLLCITENAYEFVYLCHVKSLEQQELKNHVFVFGNSKVSVFV